MQKIYINGKFQHLIIESSPMSDRYFQNMPHRLLHISLFCLFTREKNRKKNVYSHDIFFLFLKIILFGIQVMQNKWDFQKVNFTKLIVK